VAQSADRHDFALAEKDADYRNFGKDFSDFGLFQHYSGDIYDQNAQNKTQAGV